MLPLEKEKMSFNFDCFFILLFNKNIINFHCLRRQKASILVFFIAVSFFCFGVGDEQSLTALLDDKDHYNPMKFMLFKCFFKFKCFTKEEGCTN